MKRGTGWRWKPLGYIGCYKRVLHRVLREEGAVIEPDAQGALDALPERFTDWPAQHEADQHMPEAA